MILAYSTIKRDHAENYVFDGYQFVFGKPGHLLPRLLKERSLEKTASSCNFVRPQTCFRTPK